MLPEKQFHIFHYHPPTRRSEKFNQVWSRSDVLERTHPKNNQNLIDASLRASATRGRWRHLIVKWRDSGGVTHVESHSQFDECKAKEIINFPPGLEYVWWSLNELTVLGAKRQPHDCPAEERKVCTLRPKRADGGAVVEDVANSISSYGSVLFCFVFLFFFVLLFLIFISSLLNCRNSWATCASDSSNIRVENRNESRKPAVSVGLLTI